MQHMTAIVDSLRNLEHIVAEQERCRERTTLLAHLRRHAPRGRVTRLAQSAGPLGQVISAEPVNGDRWRVVVQYQTCQLLAWVDDQLGVVQEVQGC